MPIILAVDTSADCCSVALSQGQQLTELMTDTPRQHTQKLLPMIDEVLTSQAINLSELDVIAYGRGPGSFTGLRICLATVQGLAYAAEIPLVGVSTLETLAIGAQRLHHYPEGGHILVALDARMKEVYWSVYEVQQGRPVAVSEEFVMPPEAVVEQVRSLGIDTLFGIGSGWHYSDLKELQPESILEDINPVASDMIALAQSALLNGTTVDADQAQPIYLRDSVAWKKRKRIREQ